HQWFYSLVGNDQARDPWLDEALATWGQLQLGSGLPGSIATSPSSEFQHVGSPMSYWNTRQVAYFREVYGGGVVALASLGQARRERPLRRGLGRRPRGRAGLARASVAKARLGPRTPRVSPGSAAEASLATPT